MAFQGELTLPSFSHLAMINARNLRGIDPIEGWEPLDNLPLLFQEASYDGLNYDVRFKFINGYFFLYGFTLQTVSHPDGGCLWSKDGKVWAQLNMPADTVSVEGLAYGNGKWVMSCRIDDPSADYYAMYTSDDPTKPSPTWLDGNFGTSFFAGEVDYSENFNLFMTYDYDGADKVATSPDGINWTNRTLPGNNVDRIIQFADVGNNCIAIFGDPSASFVKTRCHYTQNGTSWFETTVQNEDDGSALMGASDGVTFRCGRFDSFVLNSGAVYATDNEGADLDQSAAAGYHHYQYAHGANLWVRSYHTDVPVEEGYAEFQHSEGGSVFINGGANAGMNNPQWVAYGNGMFVGIGAKYFGAGPGTDEHAVARLQYY